MDANQLTPGQIVVWQPAGAREGQTVIVYRVAAPARAALIIDSNSRTWGVSTDDLHPVEKTDGVYPAKETQEETMPVNAVIETETPTGFVVRFTLEAGYDREEVKQLVEGVEKFTQYLAGRNWTAPETSTVVQASVPSAAEVASGPMFCGYPCSPTVDAQGLPSWIIADGRQATRHEKQGDVWYSYRGDNETYVQVLRIPKGEKAPAVAGV